ncbi:MAG: hypothetical protein ACT4QD_21320 [Acidobacteriota bacterium]
MRWIDADGRLFGRVNLVDAAIGAFVVLLVPLALGTVLLFRAPTPVIEGVDLAPLTMTEDRAALGSALAGKVKVRGSGLRPVLRAEIGHRPALAFIFENPSSADVLFGDLPAGTHDLVLYDGVQEVARVAGAITIPEKPVSGGTRVSVVGTLLDLSEATSQALRQGAKFPSDQDAQMEVIALGEPEPAHYNINRNTDVKVPNRWQRSAMLAVSCQVPLLEPRECRTGGALLGAGGVLPVVGTAGSLRLFIEEVLPDQEPTPAQIRVRFLAYPSVADMVRVGDRDREQWAIDGRGATVASLGGRRQTTGNVAVGLMQDAASVSAEVTGSDQIVAFDAVLRLGVDRSRTGWRYRSDLLRAGGPITFTTRTYLVRGIVLEMTVPSASGEAGQSRP